MFLPVVLRVLPLKLSQLVGADSHQMRKNASVHVDESRSVLNKVLIGSGNIETDAISIINRHRLPNSKTTIVAAEMIMSATHEYFDIISPNWKKGEISPKMQKWIDKNLTFLQTKYGEGVASVTLHLDEIAPHLHVVLVPVTTYKIKFRRGSKEVTRINYRKLFSDDKAHLIAAQKANRSDKDTKLGRLQTEYVSALDDLGLSRGLRNSKARHVEIREYQRLLKEPTADELKTAVSFDPNNKNAILIKLPPVPRFLDRTEEKIEAVMMRSAKTAVRAFYLANKQNVDVLVTKAKDYDRIKNDNERLKVLVQTSDQREERMVSIINNQTAELAANKAEIAKLRGLDLNRVARAMYYEGPLKHGNAIDLLKDFAGLEYRPALAWLNAEFGQDATEAAASAYARQYAGMFLRTTPPVPLTKQQIVIQSAVTAQLAALDAEHYRITIMSDQNPTHNLGEGTGLEGTEKLYTAAEVAALVPQLERKNQGENYNVFVTPIAKTTHFALVDDLTPEAMSALRADGYKPNLVIESSKNRLQAVFTIDKAGIPKEIGSAVFKALNVQFGCKTAQSLVHLIRLAGFVNVSDKDCDAEIGHNPVVRLVEHIVPTCSRLVEFARQIGELTEKPHMSEATAAGKVRQVLMSQSVLEALIDNPSGLASVTLSQMAATHFQRFTWRWDQDLHSSIADFMFIKVGLANGFEVPQIAIALLAESPRIAERHPEVIQHVRRRHEAAIAQIMQP